MSTEKYFDWPVKRPIDEANEIFETGRKSYDNNREHNPLKPVRWFIKVAQHEEAGSSTVLEVEERYLALNGSIAHTDFGQASARDKGNNSWHDELRKASPKLDWRESHQSMYASRVHAGLEGGLKWVTDLVDLRYQQDVDVRYRDPHIARVANLLSGLAIGHGHFNNGLLPRTDYSEEDVQRLRNSDAIEAVVSNFGQKGEQAEMVREPLSLSRTNQERKRERIIVQTLPFSEDSNMVGAER